MEQAKAQAIASLQAHEAMLCALNDALWGYAECAFCEVQSAQALCEALQRAGFDVQRNPDGMQTAFVARYGTAEPVIAVLGEYDALSGLSQQGGVAYQAPIAGQEAGHGCGHNILGAGALGAALVAKAYIEQTGRGSVVYMGCPAEEQGTGKPRLVRAGAFKGVSAALTWHPSTCNFVRSGTTCASVEGVYAFTGAASHAAVAPQDGRSALDALELMHVGINFLREHMVEGARIHYAILDAGGTAPNVVPAHACGVYTVRAPEFAQARALFQRVDEIARGAALMTQTRVAHHNVNGGYNVIPNNALERVLYQNFASTPLPVYTQQEQAFARALTDTLPEGGEELAVLFEPRWKQALDDYAKAHPEAGMNNLLLPHISYETGCAGATDVGDVSWNVPTAQFWAAAFARRLPGHCWQNVACGNTSLAHKALLLAARVLGGAVIDLIAQPGLLVQAQEEFARRMQGRTYLCPLEMEL